ETNSSFPDGFGSPVLAVDPASQLLFGVDEFHGFLSALNLTTGALVASTVFAPNPGPSSQAVGLSYVPDHDEVVLSYDWGVNGSLLIYSARSLALVQNLTFFPGYSGYAPAQSLYIPSVDQLWVEDTQHGGVEVLNANSWSVVALLPTTPGCLGGCPSIGIVAVPRHGYVLTSDVQDYLPEVSLSNYSAYAELAGPNPVFGFGAMAYAASSDQIWVDNFSGVANGNIARFNASTGASLGPVPANSPAFGALVYDPADSAMLVSSRNASLCGSTDALLWLNSSTGALMAHACGPGFPLDPTQSYTDLAAIDLATGSSVAAAAPGGAELYSLVPGPTASLAATLSYPSIAPASQLLTWGGGGEFVTVASAPNGTQLGLYDVGSGGTQWSTTVRPRGPVGVETSSGLIYVANGSQPVLDYRLSNGAFRAALGAPPAAPVIGIGIDAFHNWAYLLEQAGRNASVQLYSIASNGTGSSLGTLALPGVQPCAWTVDPGLSAFAVTSCLYPDAPSGNNLTLVEASPLQALPSQPTGVYPISVTADASGTLYVDDEGSHELSVRNYSSGRVTNVSTPGFEASAITVEPVAHYLVGAAGAGIAVLNLTVPGWPVEARLPAPSTIGPVGVDDDGVGIYGLTAWTGQVLQALPTADPSEVGGLLASAGNSSVSLRWSAPINPVPSSPLVYSVSRANSSAGPWYGAGGGSSPYLNLTGLADGSTYFFKVSASNSAGAGPPSPPVSATPLGVPFPPTSLRATWNSSLVTLVWGAPAQDDGAVVTGYTIQWSVAGSSSWTSVSAGALTEFNATNLSQGATYLFRVIASNRIGAGNPSNEVRVPFDLPGGGPSGPLASTGVDLAILLLAVLVAIIVVVALVRRRRSHAARAATPIEAPLPEETGAEPVDAEFRPVTDAPEVEPASPPPTEPDS
ncbi:MAG TPA: fibronectin type III domain-containing protein, partial [Thermoplasmata archaeon]|nr:fibronectin type III domain-containing protein [Thermoplasmata archaeon]